MTMEDLERVLRNHPFLQGLEADQIQFLVGCARNMRFKGGDYLMRQGEQEDTLYLLRQGTVAIEMPGPGGQVICLETVGPGDALGVSLMTPSAADLDCRARDTVLAFGLDHQCLLRKMHEDPRLGFALTMKLLERTYQRLSRARLHQMDVYR